MGEGMRSREEGLSAGFILIEGPGGCADALGERTAKKVSDNICYVTLSPGGWGSHIEDVAQPPGTWRAQRASLAALEIASEILSISCSLMRILSPYTTDLLRASVDCGYSTGL